MSTDAPAPAVAFQERPYQRAFLEGDDQFPGVLAAWSGGDDAVLGVLPTGTGKTVCAGLVARHAAGLGRRTLFLAHREELITQAYHTLSACGLDCAVEMAEQSARRDRFFGSDPEVVIGTVQTLQGARLKTWPRREFQVLISDEAHHARAKSYRTIYDHFQHYQHLGITATADRGDGKNLGAVYTAVAYEYTLRRAILDGYLAPLLTVRLQTDIDLKDIRTTGGDWSAAELEEKIGPHVEALCAAARDEFGDRPTLVFTPDVGSAEAAADALHKLGTPARAVSGRMPRVERREVLRAFAAGEYQALTCCDLLIEGWDCPRVAAIVVMRPTRQRSRYAQMIGRGTRPSPSTGKANCLIIDFAWETTHGHELVVPVHLFDDTSLDDDVVEEAARLMRGDGARDPMAALEEAERIVRDRRTLQVRLTGKRTGARKFTYDPVGVGGLMAIPIKQSWDFNPQNPATTRQLDYLRKLGVAEPGELSKTGASKMIDALAGRISKSLASVRQVKYLIDLGVDPDAAREMTFAEASATISRLGGGPARGHG
jgi:superfamily II DNA or RNA helicase